MQKKPQVVATPQEQHTRSNRMAQYLGDCVKQRQLIFLTIPGLVLVFVFAYIPMYGALIAFQDYNVVKGVWGSDWVGLEYFKMFFNDPMCQKVIKNTLLLGLYSLLWSFPAPIILALFLDQLPFPKFKKFVQTVSYFPYFISSVVVVGLLKNFASIDGLFNQIGTFFGLQATPLMTEPGAFRSLFIGSGIWQGIGWGTIIYLAALSNVDPQLYEAASIDGATRFQRVRYITWPCIVPTTTIMLIFAVSGILGSDFQKILLMYNPSIYSTADVIGTYVYRMGIQGGRFEYSTAIGLMINVVSCVLLLIANQVSRSMSDNSLW